MSQGCVGELFQTAMVKESWQTDQSSYNPDPEHGLWVGTHQHPPNLCTVGACDEARPANPELLDLYDTREQWDIQEQTQ